MPTLPVAERLDDIADVLDDALTVANTATGASDTNVTDAIDRLVQFYRPNALEWNLVTISNASSISTVKDLADTIVSDAVLYHNYMFMLLTPPTGGSYTQNQVYGCSFYKASSTELTGGGMYFSNGMSGFNSMSATCAANNGDVYGWMEIKDNVLPNLRRVYAMSEDGQTLYAIGACESGANVTYDGVTPTKPDSEICSFTFDGWSTKVGGDKKSDALLNVTEDRTIYAHFDYTYKPLTVQFRNKSSGTDVLLATDTVRYGETATYTGETPVYGGVLSSDWGFWRWNPSNENIQGNTVCYAEFDNLSGPLEKYLAGTLTKYESETNTFVGGSMLQANKNIVSAEFATSEPVSFVDYAFQGVSKLNAVKLHNSTPGTMTPYAFYTTPLAAGNGGIYVPDSAVNTYKSATNWSFFNIYPLSSYPVADYATISDTWDEIAEAESDGTYLTKYHVGDTKTITFSTNGTNSVTTYMRIVGFNKDAITNGNGSTAKITWILKHTPASAKMNSTNITTGGWEDCELRTFLVSTIFASFPSELKTLIKAVDKTYYDYGTTSTLTVSDSIWIPSQRELNYANPSETSGPIYDDVYATDSNISRAITNTSGTYGVSYWLRTANNATTFKIMYSTGTINSANASSGYNYIFGFCT